MPQNKSHHFVPQFLLWLLSVDGTSIGLYNLRPGRIVMGAQAQSPPPSLAAPEPEPELEPQREPEPEPEREQEPPPAPEPENASAQQPQPEPAAIGANWEPISVDPEVNYDHLEPWEKPPSAADRYLAQFGFTPRSRAPPK